MRFAIRSLTSSDGAFALQLVLEEGRGESGRRCWLLPALPSAQARALAAYELEAGECPAFEGQVFWDEGRVTTADEPHESLRRGALKLHFGGARFGGVFVLIRYGRGQWQLQPSYEALKPRALSSEERELLDGYYRRAAWHCNRYFKNRPLTFLYAMEQGFGPPGGSMLSTPEEFSALAAKDVIELHGRNVVRGHSAHPDWLLLDFDPPAEGGEEKLLAVARVAQEALAEMGLRALWKVSGARGLHALIALRGGYGTLAVFDFAKMLAEIIVERAPALATLQRATAACADHVLVDYHRNHHHQCAIAPFSPRFGQTAVRVALPVSWNELRAAAALPRFGLDLSDERLRRATELLSEALSEPNDLELPFVAMEKLIENAR